MVLGEEVTATEFRCVVCGRKPLDTRRRLRKLCGREVCRNENATNNFRVLRKKRREGELEELNRLRAGMGKRLLSEEEYKKNHSTLVEVDGRRSDRSYRKHIKSVRLG